MHDVIHQESIHIHCDILYCDILYMLRGDTNYNFDAHTDDLSHLKLLCYILLLLADYYCYFTLSYVGL